MTRSHGSGPGPPLPTRAVRRRAPPHFGGPAHRASTTAAPRSSRPHRHRRPRRARRRCPARPSARRTRRARGGDDGPVLMAPSGRCRCRRTPRPARGPPRIAGVPRRAGPNTSGRPRCEGSDRPVATPDHWLRPVARQSSSLAAVCRGARNSDAGWPPCVLENLHSGSADDAGALHGVLEVRAADEPLRLLDGLEPMQDDDVVGVVLRLVDAFLSYAARLLHRPDAVVHLPPGPVVSDPMADDRECHVPPPTTAPAGPGILPPPAIVRLHREAENLGGQDPTRPLPTGARAILPAAFGPQTATGGPSLRRSSVVERAAVNRLVVGSSPTAGATHLLRPTGPSATSGT